MISMKRQTAWLSLAGSAILSACAGFPDRADLSDPGGAELAAEAARVDLSRPFRFAGAVDGEVVAGWEALSTDAVLAGLLREGLAASPSLRASAETVARAEALARAAQAARHPFASFTSSLGLSTPLESPDLTDTLSGSLTAGWEADLWGRIEAEIATADFDLLSARAFHEAARQALAAAIIRAYVGCIEADRQAEVTRATVAALEETLRLVAIRYDEGFSPRVELELAQADLASAMDTLTAQDAGARAARRELEVLIGRYPEGVIAVPAEFPALRTPAVVDTPAELLRRRPDILSREFDVRAAFADRAALEAGRWPDLTVSATLSGSGGLEDVIDPGAFALSLGVRLANSLFDGGLTQARLAAADASARQAVAGYGSAVLNAASDVEGRLDDIATLARRRGLLEAAVTATRETLRLAEIEYREGEADLLDVLIFRQRALSAERSLITLSRLEAEARVALYLALGGAVAP